jgi:hypothetical protein
MTSGDWMFSGIRVNVRDTKANGRAALERPRPGQGDQLHAR